ncbi:MAG TPA: DUF6526 family protein [Pyrinomonadaceae bacterium]|nr:DUF6526 family protein [Pyrinomonadaceae bacterium]
MAEETQNYQNHTRYFPLVHFVITPLLFINLIWQIVDLSRFKNWDEANDLLIAVILTLISLAARIQALKAQDRVIRLEERLRYKEVLPQELYERAKSLRTSQIIALRFASDEELPELIVKTLNGDFEKTKDIKLAVKNWRGDFLRV